MTALLTTDQAANHLGLSKHTLDQWRSDGKGPQWVKVGSRVRYRQEDLDAWVEGRIGGSRA